MLTPLSNKLDSCSTLMGNESLPKVIINDTVKFFLILQLAFW